MKKPFLHAFSAAAYIVLIVLALTSITSETGDKLIIPMLVLSMLVLSVAIMGYLFLSEPIYLYMDGKKKEAVSFFLKTLGFFASFVLLFIILFLVL